MAALQIQRVLCIEFFLESVIQSSQKSKPVPWKGNEKFDLIFSILTELQNRQALLCLGALLQGSMSQRKCLKGYFSGCAFLHHYYCTNRLFCFVFLAFRGRCFRVFVAFLCLVCFSLWWLLLYIFARKKCDVTN